jgi:predicted TIM-barrel fold metal-dependent hydrolase
MIIDTHVHCPGGPGDIDRLASECRKLKIGKVCLLGGHYRDGKIDGAILDALKKHPDLFLGFGMFRLGDDHADCVDAFKEAGFKGLKCIFPKARYDDKAFYMVYERAERLEMPMLFHLGIVARDKDSRHSGVNNDFMRPVHLDTIARAFPDLTIMGAHFGNPWTDEAAMIARWNPNIFFDLSGSILKYRPPEYFKSLLWWGKEPDYLAPDGTGPWDKLMFGSDVKIESMARTMDDYVRFMDAMELPEHDREKIWFRNAARVLKLDVQG